MSNGDVAALKNGKRQKEQEQLGDLKQVCSESHRNDDRTKS